MHLSLLNFSLFFILRKGVGAQAFLTTSQDRKATSTKLRQLNRLRPEICLKSVSTHLLIDFFDPILLKESASSYIVSEFKQKNSDSIEKRFKK